MPKAALKPCAYPQCKAYATSKGYCTTHQTQTKQYDTLRGNAHQRGYNSQWRKEREFYLRDNPLCIACQTNNRITPATVVDHIQPHKGDQDLFWDTDNWQALCAPCHNRKTAKQDMGSWSVTHKNN